MSNSDVPRKRIEGPNELYAKWCQDCTDKRKITFDRRNAYDSKDAIKLIKKYDSNLRKEQYAKDFLEFLPAEPFIVELAEIVGRKKQFNFIPTHYGEIRKFLLDQRLVNYIWFDYIHPDGIIKNGTVYFLNMIGKFYYQQTFQKSPDTMAKGFYRDKIISNRDCSVRHIDHLWQFYRNRGYDVELGHYPFDLIVDGKHAFILTEMHENSVGIEMRLSQSIFRSIKDEIQLYLPAMTPQHRRRICAIMGGILYEYRLPAYSFASYLEPEICSDRKTRDWSYYVTRKRKGPNGTIFANPLQFPKIDITSADIVATQLNGLNESDNKRVAKKVTYEYPMIHINCLDAKELIPGVKVTVGVGLMLDTWKEIANGADILVTAKIRPTIFDNLSILPKVMIVNEFDMKYTEEKGKLIPTTEDNEKSMSSDEQVYRTLKRRNVEVMMLPFNHAKAVLNGYKFLIHSMPTTNYMGNNRESFGLIDFSEHPLKNEIHNVFYEMLIAFGHNDQQLFIEKKRLISKIFQNRINIFGHFKGRKTRNWVYYKQLLYFTSKKGARILTSHLDFKELARGADQIRIQGISRYANHDSLMCAHCEVIKERMWHARLMYNSDFVALGSWDFAQITDQKELQMIIEMKMRCS